MTRCCAIYGGILLLWVLINYPAALDQPQFNYFQELLPELQQKILGYEVTTSGKILEGRLWQDWSEIEVLKGIVGRPLINKDCHTIFGNSVSGWGNCLTTWINATSHSANFLSVEELLSRLNIYLQPNKWLNIENQIDQANQIFNHLHRFKHAVQKALQMREQTRTEKDNSYINQLEDKLKQTLEPLLTANPHLINYSRHIYTIKNRIEKYKGKKTLLSLALYSPAILQYLIKKGAKADYAALSVGDNYYTELQYMYWLRNNCIQYRSDQLVAVERNKMAKLYYLSADVHDDDYGTYPLYMKEIIALLEPISDKSIVCPFASWSEQELAHKVGLSCEPPYTPAVLAEIVKAYMQKKLSPAMYIGCRQTLLHYYIANVTGWYEYIHYTNVSSSIIDDKIFEKIIKNHKKEKTYDYLSEHKVEVDNYFAQQTGEIINLLKQMLAYGFNPNIADMGETRTNLTYTNVGQTPLINSIQKQYDKNHLIRDMITTLLEHEGIDVNIPDRYGKTAITYLNGAYCKKLLEKGAIIYNSPACCDGTYLDNLMDWYSKLKNKQEKNTIYTQSIIEEQLVAAALLIPKEAAYLKKSGQSIEYISNLYSHILRCAVSSEHREQFITLFRQVGLKFEPSW